MTILSFGLSFFFTKVELSTVNWLTVDNSDLELTVNWLTVDNSDLEFFRLISVGNRF